MGAGRREGWEWPAAVGLAILSGATALGHQVLWTRRLIDLLGASAESVSRVFGCFFLGLALGAAVGLWIVGRVRRPWRWLGLAECGIFLLALPVMFLPVWSAGIWPVLGPERLEGASGSVVKFLVSVLLVTPPAFLMGWFLPLLAAAVLGGGRSLHSEGVQVYGWNTFGGVLGIGAAALFFLPLFGAMGAMFAVMIFNLVAAVGCFWLDRCCSPAGEKRNPLTGGPSRGSVADPQPYRAGEQWSGSDWRPGPALGLAFLSGFLILGLEVAAFQMLMLVAPLSFHAPAIILFCVILVLALAAWLAAYFRKRISPASLLPVTLAVAALATAAMPLVFFWIAHTGGGIGQAETFRGFVVKAAVFTLLACGPAFLVAGLLFPLLTAWSGGSGGDRRGLRWGALLAANGVGGVAGAETAYRFLLPAAGIYGSVWWIGAAYGLAAVAVAGWLTGWGRERPAPVAAALGAAVMVMLLFAPVTSLSPVNPHGGMTVLAERSGREGAIAVVEREDFGRGILTFNQYMLGTTAARYDQERQAHIPLLLHPEPREVAFLGSATGITPGAALQHDAVDTVTAIELSQVVADVAAAYFSEYNHNIAGDRRARIVVEDARTYLAASRDKFDVVVGDLFLPWGPGEARLYSREHFMEVRSALKTNGAFCQWLPLFQLTEKDLAIIANTFHQAFPNSHWFVNTFRPGSPALALVGFRDRDLDWDDVRARTAAERRAGGLRDPSVRHAPALGLFYLGHKTGKEPSSGQPVHTLNNMLIELQAGRERVTGDPAGKYIAGDRWVEWVNGLRDNIEPGADAPSVETVEAGSLLTRREVRYRRERAFDSGLERGLTRLLPPEVLHDVSADWERWPGIPPR